MNNHNKSVKLAQHLTDNAAVGTMLSHRYTQLLRLEKHCDCIFQLEGLRLKCHKLILAAASPVFEAMFYGALSDVENAQQQIIDIPDISAEVFQVLLAHIYAGKVDFEQLTLEQCIELYYGAEKYLLSELIDACLAAITCKLRFANILPALELSVCMDFSALLQVCMSFFTRCCLLDAQYMSYLKAHYFHVSKNCIKTIVELNKQLPQQQQLLWFIFEWCKQECQKLGLQQADASHMLMHDLHVANNQNMLQEIAPAQQQQEQQQQCHTVERIYFKACRPFAIASDSHIWKLHLKCNRFISLLGLIMHSRLTPSIMHGIRAASEYEENLRIEISANGEAEQQPAFSWRHSFSKRQTKYNCDLNIFWNEGVVLSPDVHYQLQIIWPSQAFGAEYPCSVQSNTVHGIELRDFDAHCGSLVKGLRYINLV